MGAANGFVTVRPDAYYGDLYDSRASGHITCMKFTAPGSGIIEISEVGFYGAAYVNGRVGIFTHNVANGAPDSLVANGDSGEQFFSSAVETGLNYATYSTKPQLIGGAVYWICLFLAGSYNPRYFDTGGTSLVAYNATYPTWPANAAAWEAAHYDYDNDYAIYAVYEDVGGGSSEGLNVEIMDKRTISIG